MTTKASRKTIETAIFMFFIVLAGFLQYYDISLPPFYAQTFSYLANTIFLILIFIWGKSIRQRIIQKGIRRKLVIIAVLLFFWLFLCLARIFLPLSHIGTTPRGCGTKKVKIFVPPMWETERVSWLFLCRHAKERSGNEEVALF